MTVIINAKADEDLKQAIRITAAEEKYKSASALMVHVLENFPKIKENLEKIKAKK